MIGIKSCREVSELISQGLDRELGLGERIVLGLHVRICTGCARFKLQLGFLRRAVARLPPQDITGAAGDQST